jgi:hypothetical protein
MGLTTRLTHAESGQWRASLAVVPLPKADPQGYGSCVTYARRYALTAMLGMVAGDDDGEGAKITPQKRGRKNAVKQVPPDFMPESSPQSPEHPDMPRIDGIRYRTHHFFVDIYDSAFVQSKSAAEVWVGTDERHLPLKVRSKLKIGYAEIYCKTSGQPETPPNGRTGN